jgi:hypothetical protein
MFPSRSLVPFQTPQIGKQAALRSLRAIPEASMDLPSAAESLIIAKLGSRDVKGSCP